MEGHICSCWQDGWLPRWKDCSVAYCRRTTDRLRLRIPSGIPSDPAAAAAATGAPSNMGGFASMLNSIAQDPSIREAAQGFANGDMGGLSGLLNNPAISQM